MKTCLAASLLIALGTAIAPAQQTQMASIGSAGETAAAGEPCTGLALSADGRWVAFASYGSGLVPGDTNGRADIFVRDRRNGSTVRVSLDSAGGQGGADCFYPAISGDGRHVAWESTYRHFDLLRPTGGESHVFVHDRDADGNGVFDEGPAPFTRTVVVSRDDAGVPATKGDSARASISADGQLVAFHSTSPTLVPGDTNGVSDVFVHDRDFAGNGVLDQVQPGATRTLRAEDPATVPPGGHNGASRSPHVAPFSFGTGSGQGNAVIVFESAASDMAGNGTGFEDVFAWHVYPLPGRIVHVSVDSQLVGGNAPSFRPSASGDGRYVGFASLASNFSAVDVPFVFDVFLHDRDADGDGVFDEAGAVSNTLVSHTPTGAGSQGIADQPALSHDGSRLAWITLGPDVVPGDTNGFADVFLYTVATDSNVRASVGAGGEQASLPSSEPTISGDGRVVGFLATAPDLDPRDDNGMTPDIFVRECPASDFAASVYCTGKTNSLGCVPFLATLGCPSATDPEPFAVQAHDVLPSQPGVLVYNFAKAQLAFHCGTLCVKAVGLERLPGKFAKSQGAGCSSGILRFDFNGVIQSGADPRLTLGQRVYAQWRQRDPADACGQSDSLTDAVSFTIAP